MNILLVIPARYGSTRFPGKPLARLAGKPMVQHVYERCARVRGASAVLVATDDERIAAAVQAFGGSATMTPASLASGTERVAWAVRESDADIVVNVQGDEPLLPDGTVEAAVEGLLKDSSFDIGTVATPCTGAEELASANVVKVARAADGTGLYFSRSPIPAVRDATAGSEPDPALHLRHIGIYAFRFDALQRFASLPASRLEEAEKLEQLRALEAGMRIYVGLVPSGGMGVDTPDDLRRVEEMLG